jgi:hypothetical protein
MSDVRFGAKIEIEKRHPASVLTATLTADFCKPCHTFEGSPIRSSYES